MESLSVPYYSCLKLIKTFSTDSSLSNSNKKKKQVLCLWSFTDISDRGPVEKGHRRSDLLRHICCSIPEDSAPWQQIRSYLIRVFQRLSVALHMSDPTQGRDVAQRPLRWEGGWQTRLKVSAPWVAWILLSHSVALNPSFGDFALESSTTPKYMVCEFWIETLVSPLPHALTFQFS